MPTRPCPSSVERHDELTELARKRLAKLGFDNVTVKHGDGTLGWAEKSPFDPAPCATSWQWAHAW